MSVCKLKLIKVTGVVQVPSRSFSNLPPFNSFHDSPNEAEQRGLAKNNKNPLNYTFSHFDLVCWWEPNKREGSNAHPFEEVTHH